MRKLIAVGVLVGGLLAGVGPVTDAAVAAPLTPRGGIGDPLTLAASGVILPYITGASGGTVALIEISSPVGANSNMHMLFFNNTCARVGDSVGIAETANDIAFKQVETVLPAGTSGLATIAGVLGDGFTLTPLGSPIHSRVYLFDPANGRSRVLEPIIADTAEFGGTGIHFWSPLRTAATFFAPLETDTVKTQLTLVCPRTSILGLEASPEVKDDPNTPGNEAKPAVARSAFGGGTGALTSLGFPNIDPPFKSSSVAGDMRARVYDTNESFLRDVGTTCDCLTPDLSVTSISSVYSSAAEAPNGTYTELEVTDPTKGSFTGWRGVFTVGSSLNNFWGRLSNGNRTSIQGGVTSGR